MLILDIDRIENTKTKKLFKEVNSCFANGNYRSANVMLYSVAVCDLLFKLQELDDMYDDKKAKKILDDYNKNKEEANKSSWEHKLIDKLHEETEIVDDITYSHLNRLYEDRNFSAHPALNNDFNLISPSKEDTIANILNVYNDILVKPALFINKIKDSFLEDIIDKGEMATNDSEMFLSYFNNKYISKMSDNMKTKLFRDLWKFSFVLTEDEDCKNNRNAVRMVLSLFFEDDSLNFYQIVKDDAKYYAASNNEDCIQNLILLLSKHEELYDSLSDEVKSFIDSYINKNYSFNFIAWFKHKNIAAHIKYLESLEHGPVKRSIWLYMQEYYSSSGLIELYIDFVIDFVKKSTYYDLSDNIFDNAILPIVDKFTMDQFERLFNVINSNDQIYNRRKAGYINTRIVIELLKKYPNDIIDFNTYPNIVFNEKVLNMSNSELEDYYKQY